MNIHQNSTPEVVFLLVRERDGITGIEDAQNILCGISWPGNNFSWMDNAASGLREIGRGWYGIRLSATATANLGALIFVAKSDDSYEWRDIHQVSSILEPTGCNYDEIAAMIDEAMSALPTQEVDVDAMIDMVAEVLTVESEIVRRGAEIAPHPPVAPFVPPIGEWSLHCGGEIVRTVDGDAATFRRQNKKQGNCQTFTVFSIEPGRHRLTFWAEAKPSMTLGVALHLHGAPYTDLAASAEVQVDGVELLFDLPLEVAEGAERARLRFWLGDLVDGGELLINDVRLWRIST